MKNKIKKIENWLFTIPLLFVAIVKFPHLSLPYFWDEAWSYFPAVYKMYETGPGLLPGALPLWDAKGHPLFFFFLSSSWMQLVGTSVFGVHVLPFLISLATLTALFFVVKKHTNLWAANIAVLLFSVQSLFLAQVTMLLPEMLITLLLLLAINSYLNQKYLAFAIWSSIMVLTKETSIVFVGGFLLYHLAVYLKPGKESRKYILESLLILLPILVYGSFLILHKKEFGSFFFQEHTGYIQLSFASIMNKLKIATGIIFTRYGRNIILLAVVVALVYLLLKKKKLKNKNLLGLLVFQTVIFLLFSALNFYTQRYMLVLLALFVIIAGVLLEQVRFKKMIVNGSILALIIAVPLFYTFTKKSSADSDLGYVQVVKVHQEMVKYCEEQAWQDEPIAASFNLIFCLRNPHLGYVSNGKGFSNVVNLDKFKDAGIFINECTSYGAESQLDSIKSENKMVKEFRLKHAWGEIYTNQTVK
ncbi:ArnT family glycosyltransferase [Maribellus maritimus]|uniref:ArnT family glycosyltransferase n=1 Tax=Maribellus maritimus TaxID=2870838 RepID=UPI001EEC0F4E|nr:glycosyltransferase family 39 protein [Maribellus maritimus]MCG6186596.1 glycosyltransferase family 39 protein [Maribellus maritimus]